MLYRQYSVGSVPNFSHFCKHKTLRELFEILYIKKPTEYCLYNISHSPDFLKKEVMLMPEPWKGGLFSDYSVFCLSLRNWLTKPHFRETKADQKQDLWSVYGSSLLTSGPPRVLQKRRGSGPGPTQP